ncbi:hypothetical protein GCM10010171_49930 [Actinokineospora fastidiosa]|uniref:Uncharacterized protein n=1 Tax=Actinokineospora fastidiosa TaxID=1816 RepID=A0A918LH77_9PSEU|nr:hypothetical protein GCM10010171_49930 [Actinokineospora fastidiosa]
MATPASAAITSSQLLLAEIGGYAPTRCSAYASSTREYSSELLEAVQKARLRPLTVHYTEFSKAFRTGIARALDDDGKLEPTFAKERSRWRWVRRSAAGAPGFPRTSLARGGRSGLRSG